MILSVVVYVSRDNGVRCLLVLCYVGLVDIVMKFTKFCLAVARVSRMRVSLDIPRGIDTL
jgi:hypothetical protein